MFGLLSIPSTLQYPLPVLGAGAILLGFSIGILTGLFGVGGGFLVVPLLNVLLGVPYPIAVGSSLFFILGTSAMALPSHIREGNFEPRAVLYLAAGSILGAFFGDVVQDFLKYTVAGGNTGIFEEWMHSFFLALLALTVFLLLRPAAGPQGKEGHRESTPIQRLSIPPYTRLEREGLPMVSIPGLLGIGFLIGILTGLLGVGGGVVFMPVLLLVIGLRPKLAVGTSLGVVMAASLAGLVKKLLAAQPKVSLSLTLMLFLGSVLGVRVGIRIFRRIESTGIRKYFVFVILLAMGIVAWDLLTR
ncbi:MAG: hypothetical protein Kow009_06440 [Spirochaetales bacterium]